MTCYYPIKGWHKSGGGFTTRPREALVDRPLAIPCSKCIGCRLRYARDWSIRSVHEASLHEENDFLTLTYDEKNIPENQSLVKKDFQLFIKRIRKKFGEGIKYIHCGEYGEKNGRPHYHAIIFGVRFGERVELGNSKSGYRIYTSPELLEIWKKGRVTCQDVTFQSAGYVARYAMKKVEIYLDYEDEEDYYKGREHEYITMSRGGRKGKGIAYDFYQQNKKNIYKTDSVVIEGKVFKPPRYYDSIYAVEHPDLFRKIMVNREVENAGKEDDYSDNRLYVRERVKRAQIKSLNRGI